MQYGVFHDLPYDDYAAIAALRSSVAEKMMAPTDAHARHDMDAPDKGDGEALIRGRVLHTLLLEPHLLDQDYSIEREKLWNKSTKVINGGSKEKWDALKDDAEKRLVTLVSYDLFQDAQGMAESVKRHPEWQRLAPHCDKELTIVAPVRGQPMKVRYDLMCGETVLDIKSCREYLTDDNIRKVIEDRAYHMKAAMYLKVGRTMNLPVQKFQWVFVENFPPYLCRFVEASEHMLAIGNRQFYECIERYERCRSSRVWQGYDDSNISVMNLSDSYLRKNNLA